jgi:beta-lactamase superfamily II metal-dependent hydrolase
MFKIDFLPAKYGDSIWLEYGEEEKPQRIIIDGGFASTYKEIKKRLKAIPEDKRDVELLIISHVDEDHITGILNLLKDTKINVNFKEVWFNGYRHLTGIDTEAFGPVQGEKLTTALDTFGPRWNGSFHKNSVSVTANEELPRVNLSRNMKITLLSPYTEQLVALQPVWAEECRKAGLDPKKKPAKQESAPPGLEHMGTIDVEKLSKDKYTPDTSIANGSSIAILAEYDEKTALLSGDANPETLLKSINTFTEDETNLKLDLFKLPHHGSKYNLSPDLLKKLRPRRYIISTNGERFRHPDAETIARILVQNEEKREIMFNYRTELAEIWSQTAFMQKYNYSIQFPEKENTGLSVQLS